MESLVKMLMNAKKVSQNALTSAQILKEVTPVRAQQDSAWPTTITAVQISMNARNSGHVKQAVTTPLGPTSVSVQLVFS
jgi:hypothetical protein